MPSAVGCAALQIDRIAVWFDGMGDDNVDDFRLFLTDKAAARAKTDADREKVLTASPADLADSLKTLLSPVDAAALTGDIADYLTQVNREGLAPGSEGWWDDGCAQVGRWGFEVADISVPTLVVHGRHDQFVPFSHGQWLATHIPGAEAWLLEDDGHVTLLKHRMPQVHAWLADWL